MGFLTNQFVEVPTNATDNEESKDTESQFPAVTGNHPTEGHAWVLYKLDIDDIFDEHYTFTVVKIQLDPYLEPLIQDENQ